MTFQSHPYPVKELLISHSTMEAYDSCKRKFEFAKLFGFNLRTRTLPTAGGIAIHEALGVYVKTKSKDLAIMELLKRYPIDLCTNPLWNWSLEASYAALINLIAYLQEHTELEIAIIQGKPAIEVPFLINILHGIDGLMPVKYRGFIDFIFYNRLTDSYCVLDLKNTTANTKDFTPVYKFSPQCLPYGMVLNQALGKDFTSFDVEYLIAKVHLTEPKITKLEFNKSIHDVEEWSRDLYMDLINIKTFIDSQWFPRKKGNCVTYNRQCKYFDLCSSRNVNTLLNMLATFKQGEDFPFDPWITLDLEIA